MELCLAKHKDIEKVMELIEQAKQHLNRLGIAQWQGEYPDTACIQNDIKLKSGYLLIQNGEVAGYLCMDFYGEPSYDVINGAWKSMQPYGTLHRLTIGDSFKGMGLSTEAFRLGEKLCLQKNIHSIKVDTHENNFIMKHILQKCGFSYCGIILYDGMERVAFQKLF